LILRPTAPDSAPGQESLTGPSPHHSPPVNVPAPRTCRWPHGADSGVYRVRGVSLDHSRGRSSTPAQGLENKNPRRWKLPVFIAPCRLSPVIPC